MISLARLLGGTARADGDHCSMGMKGMFTTLLRSHETSQLRVVEASSYRNAVELHSTENYRLVREMIPPISREMATHTRVGELDPSTEPVCSKVLNLFDNSRTG
jgi:hypothetical protein